MTSKKIAMELKPSVAPRFALVAIVLLSVTLISILMIQRLAGAESNAQVGPADLVQATQEFAAGEEMTLSAQNLTVHIPKNSITWTGSIMITSRDPDLFAVAGDTEWTRTQVYSVEFVNGKGTPVPGIIFSNPVQICFKITNEQWKDFLKRPEAYQVQYFAVEQNPQVWEALPLKAYSGELCGIVHHLSLFGLAIKDIPQIPITGSSPTPTVTRTELPPTREHNENARPTAAPQVVPTATKPPTLPPTEPPTEPPTLPPTEPPTQPPTEPPPPPTEPPTQPPTEPPPPPTEPPTAPPGPPNPPGSPNPPGPPGP